ncbi:MAG: ATP-grasp domain-containing protein [Spartobacteria bacterium]|nr:ATP-grasp domain-containing protein [Spartobacteria bacterium]
MYSGILKGKKVALLKGGPGKERDVSLRSATAVAKALHICGAEVHEIDVTGPEFHLPEGTELAFHRGIAYTGEGINGSRTAFDKIRTKECFDRAGVPTSTWHSIRAGESPRMELPYVVKAPQQGSSVGVHIVRNPESLASALEDCFKYGDEILVEAFFPGRELTVGILGKVALPVVEIVPKDGFYDYDNKYTSGASEYFVPAPLSPELALRVQQTALAAHHALDLEVYSRVDILLAPDGSMSVLEINTIPGMTELSLLPKAAAVAGLDYSSLCEEIAGLSLAKKHR